MLPGHSRIIMWHLFLHITLPLCLALALDRQYWVRTYGLLMAGMLIDVDHLLATPIYDPNRCSIGFHPLHTLWPILGYVAALCLSKTRLLAMGLCLHILLDSLDCYAQRGIWFS